MGREEVEPPLVLLQDPVVVCGIEVPALGSLWGSQLPGVVPDGVPDDLVADLIGWSELFVPILPEDTSDRIWAEAAVAHIGKQVVVRVIGFTKLVPRIRYCLVDQVVGTQLWPFLTNEAGAQESGVNPSMTEHPVSDSQYGLESLLKELVGQSCRVEDLTEVTEFAARPARAWIERRGGVTGMVCPVVGCDVEHIMVADQELHGLPVVVAVVQQLAIPFTGTLEAIDFAFGIAGVEDIAQENHLVVVEVVEGGFNAGYALMNIGYSQVFHRVLFREYK